MLGCKRPESSTCDARILPAPVFQELVMTNSICIAAEAAPRTHPAARFITLAPVLLIAALVGACAAKTNTGATVAERSFGAGAGAQGTAGEAAALADGGASADGSQGAAGERSSSAGAAAGGRSGDGTAGSAQGDSSLYGDSADDEDGADEFTGIAGEDAAGAAGAEGAGGGTGGAGPGGRSGSGTSGSSAASHGDDSSIAGQDGTSAGGAAGGRTAAGGAGGAGAEGEMAGAGGAAGGEGRGASGSAASGADGAGGAGGAGGRRAGQGGAGADGASGDAVGGAGSDQESMVVGMVDAPGSRVRIDEEVTPQTLGGMLPLTVGVDEEGHFDFDQAVLRPEVKSVLDELSVRLREAEWDRLDILGYTDRIGTDDYNQQLSERRAWAVARYLMVQGIPVNKMRVEGRGRRGSQLAEGECRDLERTDLIACLQKDRRVEIEASIRKTEAKIQ
jgi:outer membrane protein OmpA-like peptidoglycan-associated protein